MDFQETHSWTLVDIVSAFLQLALAYFLLCGSAFAFFALKFWSFFGIFMPCPCEGFLGFRNSNLCFNEMLLDWPARKICSIRKSALERFPFDLLLLKDHSCSNSNENLIGQRTLEYEVQKLGDEASCSSYSATRSQYLVDRDKGYDFKGKRVINLKRKSGIRRRRKAAHVYGNLSSPIISSNSPQPDGTHVSFLQKGDSEHLDKNNDSLYCAIGDVDLQQDDEVAATGNDVDEKSCHSYEFNGSFVDNKDLENYTSSMDMYMNSIQDKIGEVGNELKSIKMLEQALEEEKAARIALYLELEKERAAAETAANEAMAMMFRLQEEKASIEMEMRQYQRVIEERFAYDEEEMDILKEMLIRREKDNHMLEREIETYRRMSSGGNDLSAVETNGMEGGPYFLFDVQEDLVLDLPEVEYAPCVEVKTENGSNSYESQNITASQMTTSSCSSCDAQEREKDIEQTGQVEYDLHGSTVDSEPIVVDVHVIDDDVDLRKEKTRKGTGLSFNSTADGPGDDNLDKISVTSSDPKGRASVHVSRGDSSSSDNSENLKIDNEIEMLGKKLQMLQCGREKLIVLKEKGESQYDQFKLLEEIANQLQEIKQLGDPARWTLPTSSSKVKLQARRCQSGPLNQWDSA